MFRVFSHSRVSDWDFTKTVNLTELQLDYFIIFSHHAIFFVRPLLFLFWQVSCFRFCQSSSIGCWLCYAGAGWEQNLAREFSAGPPPPPPPVATLLMGGVRDSWTGGGGGGGSRDCRRRGGGWNGHQIIRISDEIIPFLSPHVPALLATANLQRKSQDPRKSDFTLIGSCRSSHNLKGLTGIEMTGAR